MSLQKAIHNMGVVIPQQSMPTTQALYLAYFVYLIMFVCFVCFIFTFDLVFFCNVTFAEQNFSTSILLFKFLLSSLCSRFIVIHQHNTL